MKVQPKQRWSCTQRGIIVEIIHESHALVAAWHVRVLQKTREVKGFYYQIGDTPDFYDSRFQDGEFQYLEGQESPG